ncbi:TauD/TfdA family dioxygenase [Vibrio fluvialis]|nr:TauD/TfdA family dioxygenase [Vibrio fluvialis]
MSTTTTQSFTITPLRYALGAKISGIDMNRPLTYTQWKQLQAASNQYHVLIFQSQSLSDQSLFDFATYFGDVFIPPADVPVLASDAQGNVPSVVPVSNKQGGHTGNVELHPHIDHLWTPRPSKASFLYAVQVTQYGGQTTWYNLQKAWEALDTKTKKQIAALSLVTYNPFLNEPGEQRPLYRDNNIPTKGKGYLHPLVLTHPESGKSSLYLSADTEVEIPELDNVAGKALIERLRVHTFSPEFAYQHQWQVGDVVWWDNRSTAHARSPFPSEQIRDLRRVSLAGSRPV